MKQPTILGGGGKPAARGRGLMIRARGRALRAPILRAWAAVAALFAAFSIVIATPAHALLLKSPPSAAQTVTFNSIDAATPAKVKSPALRAHACSLHCAAHVLALPDQTWPAAPLTGETVEWLSADAAALGSNDSFGLKRPPRV